MPLHQPERLPLKRLGFVRIVTSLLVPLNRIVSRCWLRVHLYRAIPLHGCPDLRMLRHSQSFAVVDLLFGSSGSSFPELLAVSFDLWRSVEPFIDLDPLDHLPIRKGTLGADL